MYLYVLPPNGFYFIANMSAGVPRREATQSLQSLLS